MASVIDRPELTDDSAHSRAEPRRGRKAVGVGAVGAVPAGMTVALAAGAAIVGLGHFVEDSAAAAEAGYLAILTVLLLGCVAALGTRQRGGSSAPAALLAWSAMAVVTAAWVLPPGPGRGAAVLALLVTSVAVAACRTGLRGLPSSTPSEDGDRGPGGEPGTLAAVLHATGAVLPMVIAAQVVFRSGDLLRPELDAHTLVVFLVMPLAVALKIAFLAVRRGPAPAGIAAATVLLWTGGLNVAATVAFLALAAGEILRDPGVGNPGVRDAEPVDRGSRRRALLLRACAVAVLVAPFAWQPRTAAVAAGAGLLMTGGVAAAAAVAVAAVVAVVLVPLQGWPAVASLLGLGLLLLPLVPWSAARRAGSGAGHPLTLAAGLALAVAAARCAPAQAATAAGDVHVPALAAPLALLALYALARPGASPRPAGADRPVRPTRPVGPGLALQGLWSGGLLLAAGVASAYPWLRPDATRSVLAALNLDPAGSAPWVTAVVATLAAAALAGLTAFLARRGEPGRHPRLPGTARTAGLAALAVAVAVAVLLLLTVQATPAPPFGRTLVGHPGVLLSADAPRVEAVLETEGAAAGQHPEIHRLALVGSLVRAEGVEDGTPVATVTILAGDHPLVTWPLRAGEDLGEWAARRPAVAAALMHRPPAPWASWVAPDGDYLGQVYRARHDARGTGNRQAPPGGTTNPSADGQAPLDSPLRLVLERAPGLPSGTQIHVRRLEAWP